MLGCLGRLLKYYLFFLVFVFFTYWSESMSEIGIFIVLYFICKCMNHESFDSDYIKHLFRTNKVIVIVLLFRYLFSIGSILWISYVSMSLIMRSLPWCSLSNLFLYSSGWWLYKYEISLISSQISNVGWRSQRSTAKANSFQVKPEV